MDVFKTRDIPDVFLQALVHQWDSNCAAKTHAVSKEWGVDSLKTKSDYIFVAHRLVRRRFHVCGFLVLQHNPNRKMGYIDIVCSGEKYGGKLIRLAEQFCKDVLKCDYMKLSALPEVEGYYSSVHGYNHFDAPCSKSPVPRRKAVRVPGYRGRSLISDVGLRGNKPKPGNNGTRPYNGGDGWRMTKCIAG